MKYKIIACFDTNIEAFMPPQAVNDMLDEDIIESNRRAVVNKTIPAEKAEKLILFKIGSFDDKTGKLEPSFEKLCNLASFVKKPVEEVKNDGEQSSANSANA